VGKRGKTELAKMNGQNKREESGKEEDIAVPVKR